MNIFALGSDLKINAKKGSGKIDLVTLKTCMFINIYQNCITVENKHFKEKASGGCFILAT
jgi:hypothetical protein